MVEAAFASQLQWVCMHALSRSDVFARAWVIVNGELLTCVIRRPLSSCNLDMWARCIPGALSLGITLPTFFPSMRAPGQLLLPQSGPQPAVPASHARPDIHTRHLPGSGGTRRAGVWLGIWLDEDDA